MAPGWQSTEFLAMLAAQIIALLVLFGVIPEGDAPAVNKNVAAMIASAGSIIAYIASRTAVKVAALKAAPAPAPAPERPGVWTTTRPAEAPRP